MSISRKSNQADAAVEPATAANTGTASPAIATKAHALEAPEPAIPEPAIPKPLRTGNKAASLIEMLTRADGASRDEMIERTGWLGHTVRAAMTGLRKKDYAIDKRVSGNVTVWFIRP